MPLVRDSPVAGTLNWASIYSATARHVRIGSCCGSLGRLMSVTRRSAHCHPIRPFTPPGHRSLAEMTDTTCRRGYGGPTSMTRGTPGAPHLTYENPDFAVLSGTDG